MISRQEGSAASYYIYDGGLSVRALTNEAGTVTDTLVFDAFGNETTKTGTSDNSYGFQGEEQDATGLYYLRARYMDPVTGTFTSMDTYGGSLTDPMSLHKYLFANSNPVAYCDPSGHFSMTEQVLVCGLIGELASAVIYTVELLTTDNIKYNSWWEAGYGALRAVLAGFTAGVVMWALHTVFAAIVGTALAAIVFGSFGIIMSILGIMDGALDWENGDTELGSVKVLISIISLVFSVDSVSSGVQGFSKGGEGVGSPAGNSGSNRNNDNNTTSSQNSARRQLAERKLADAKSGKYNKAFDNRTNSEIGRIIGDDKGNLLIEPVGGSTVPAGKNGMDTHTLYPNGSNYQRYNPYGHANNTTPHGHGHLMGTGPGKKGQGPSIDVWGNVVPFNSSDAHWPIY